MRGVPPLCVGRGRARRYLPPAAAAPLLASVAGLMAPGSVLIGDCFCNLLSTPAARRINALLATHGAAWTGEVATTAELEALLFDAGLRLDGPRCKVMTAGGDPNRSTILFQAAMDAAYA